MSQPKTEQYWTMKDGTKIAVGDMSVDHLRNVLRLLIRTDRIKPVEIEYSSSMVDEYDTYHGAAEWWKE